MREIVDFICFTGIFVWRLNQKSNTFVIVEYFANEFCQF